MSERGSFVTEYIYCRDCFEALRKVLFADPNKYLSPVIVPKSADIPGEDRLYPIIAGKIGGLGPADEVDTLETELLKVDLCHDVRIAVLAESGVSAILVFGPTGSGSRSEATAGTETAPPHP